MLYKDISLMNGSDPITFSSYIINFPNITAPEYRITTRFPITGYTIDSKSFNLGTNSTTVLSCNTFINLKDQGISTDKLTYKGISLSNSNINIGEFRYTGSTDPFIISGTVSSLTTNTIVLTKTTDIYTPTISGTINTKALTLNSSEWSKTTTKIIDNHNDYSISVTSSAIIKINVSINGSTYWEHITYTKLSYYVLYQSSLRYKFSITITPNQVTYRHDGDLPWGTTFRVDELARISLD